MLIIPADDVEVDWTNSSNNNTQEKNTKSNKIVKSFSYFPP